MPEIHVLDSETIDKIAAGEVVERPASVVKELVENSIDANANAITVEIKDGGISLIRVTDNGYGMEKEQVKCAFLRHATSKITNADDLDSIVSLGFRGEALSSIAAVSQVEMITKTQTTLTGTRIRLEGGTIAEFEEVGAPEGTTFLVRNLFFNTPVRKKFLKQPQTEGGYVSDLMEHLALSHPDISFKYTIGNQLRFFTSGNGDLKEVIYRIYGREIANCLVGIKTQHEGMSVSGYLGKPVLVRSNRNFETCFINHRYIKSTTVMKAVEEGYREYLMQHKFPFCVLHITVDPGNVDVNVHPTKMSVRFSDTIGVSNFLTDAVRDSLHGSEMIPQEHLTDDRIMQREEKELRKEETKRKIPEPFEKKRSYENRLREMTNYHADTARSEDMSDIWQGRVEANKSPNRELNHKITQGTTHGMDQDIQQELQEGIDLGTDKNIQQELKEGIDLGTDPDIQQEFNKNINQAKDHVADSSGNEQLNLFDEKIIEKKNRDEFRMIGQVFDTYWMFQFHDKLCILDQHAAHEKVKYERFMKHYREKETLSQKLMPPVIISLTGQEEMILKEYQNIFEQMGFEIECFGGSEYALRSVPMDLFGCSEKEMFLEVLDDLEAAKGKRSPAIVEERIATRACKAAVKGNNRLTLEEAQELIDELLTLDNPYNCPHGRPTIITISKYEMEKKFKRIVT